MASLRKQPSTWKRKSTFDCHRLPKVAFAFSGLRAVRSKPLLKHRLEYTSHTQRIGPNQKKCKTQRTDKQSEMEHQVRRPISDTSFHQNNTRTTNTFVLCCSQGTLCVLPNVNTCALEITGSAPGSCVQTPAHRPGGCPLGPEAYLVLNGASSTDRRIHQKT